MSDEQGDELIEVAWQVAMTTDKGIALAPPGASIKDKNVKWVWLAKAKARVIDGHVMVPRWLAEKNELL